MDQNPFSPPRAEVADDPRLSEDSPPKSLVMLVLALFAIHAVIMWRNFGFYFESVRTGAVHPIGPLVRVELLHGSEIVEVELSRERHETLQLAVGQPVWFRPRQMKVFGGDASRSTGEKQAFLF